MRFIATADWHLGMSARNLDDEARPRFQQARLDVLRTIAELATRHSARFVVACGDLFDSNQLDRGLVGRTFEALAQFTVPVYLIPGNHDPLDSMSIYDSAPFLHRCPENVHVVRDAQPQVVAPGLELVGVPWHSKRPLTDQIWEACENLEPTEETVRRVIAGHGIVSTLSPDAADPSVIDVDRLESILQSGRAQVAVLGDRHGTYEVAKNIWYAGAPEVTHRREEDPGNVLLIDVSDRDAVKVEKLRTGRWRFETVSQTVNSDADIEELVNRLRAMPDKELTGIWLALQGTLTTAQRVTLDEQLEELAELFARLDYWRRHTNIAVVSGSGDFDDLSLGGFAKNAVDELLEMAAGSGTGASDAQDALNLLYRFARSGE